MIAAQQKRMAEGRHNFAKGHPLYGGGIVANMEGKPPPRKGLKNSPEHIAKAAEALRRLWATPEYRAHQHEIHSGRKQSAEWVQNRVAGRTGYRHSEATRRKISDAHKQRASQHHLWQGGITAEHKRIRKSVEFKLWREAVFARDNWTCQHCGERGTELHPDHIKPFATHPELRFDINNGRTLCKACHMKTDTWGIKALRHAKETT